jgi:AraC family transcriptional activator of pobA
MMNIPQHHLPCLESEINESFSISRLSDQNSIETYRLSYHRIILIEKGKGTILVDGNTFQIDENQLYLISKGQIFGISCEAELLGTEISFGDCFWERSPASANNCKAVLFNNAADNQQVLLEQKDINELTPLFASLYSEYKQPVYVNKIDAMAAYLKIIMIKIANINALLIKGYDDFEKQVFRKFLGLVSSDYYLRHEVSDYSNQLNITSRRLSELCKRSSGKGAKEIINGQIIAEAKRNLHFTSLTIKEIAYQLNFATPEQFSHFFKKHTLATPSEYRSSFMRLGS